MYPTLSLMFPAVAKSCTARWYCCMQGVGDGVEIGDPETEKNNFENNVTQLKDISAIAETRLGFWVSVSFALKKMFFRKHMKSCPM